MAFFSGFYNFIQQKIEVVRHVACLPISRLFETESKVARTHNASRKHRKTGTPQKQFPRS